MLGSNIQFKKVEKNKNLLTEQTVLIETLEKKVETANLQQFYQQTSLNFPERLSPSKQKYALELSLQIEEKKRIEQEKLNKSKDVASESNFCSLNFPHTPARKRRLKERERQQLVKKELEDQINEKDLSLKTEKKNKLENEKRENFQIIQSFMEEEKEKMISQKLEFEFYAKSWKNQMHLKELQSQVMNIEVHGRLPRARSFVSKKETGPSLLTIVPKTEEVKENTDREESIERKPEETTYQDKAKAIKEKLQEQYKKSYQYKITQLVNQARSARKEKSSSLSPLSKKRARFAQ